MITLYGMDHSPWTQMVLITLHVKGAPYRLVSVPPLRHVRRHGIVMPQADGLGDKHVVGSQEILSAIEAHYPSPELGPPTTPTDLVALERLFLSYVVTRAWTSNRWRFWVAWSRAADAHPRRVYRWLAAASRAFVCAYFFLLLSLAGLSRIRMGKPAVEMRHLERHLDHWDSELERVNTHFLNGHGLGHRDIALLGHMQCLLTGLTDGAKPLIEQRPRLTEWLNRVHDELPDYRRMYSRRLGDREHQTQTARPDEQIAFWVGFSLLVVFTPVTVLALVWLVARRGSTRHRSGAFVAQDRSRRDPL